MAQQSMAVVLWGAHRWGREDSIAYAHAAGLDVWLATDANESLPDNDLVTGVLHIRNPEELQAPTEQLNSRYSRWASIALDDFVSRPAAKLAELAPTPTVNLNATNTCCLKHQLRQIWNGLCADDPQLHPVPYKRVLYKDFEGNVIIEESGKDINGSAIIKPNDYAGSVGVSLIKGDEEATIKQLLQLLAEEDAKFKGSLHVLPDVLIEAAIPRKELPGSQAEFTIHMGSIQGEHVLLATSEKTLHPNSFIETGHRVPAPHLPAEALELMEQSTRQMLNMLGLQNTISNWEYIITPDNKIALIEGQLRPSGDSLMQLIELATSSHPYSWFFQGLIKSSLQPFLTAQYMSGVSWLWPQQVQQQITDIILPENIPPNWHINANRPVLLAAQNWPGPADWYQRHLSITGQANSHENLNRQMYKLANEIKLVGNLGVIPTSIITPS